MRHDNFVEKNKFRKTKLNYCVICTFGNSSRANGSGRNRFGPMNENGDALFRKE